MLSETDNLLLNIHAGLPLNQLSEHEQTLLQERLGKNWLKKLCDHKQVSRTENVSFYNDGPETVYVHRESCILCGMVRMIDHHPSNGMTVGRWKDA